MKRIYIYLFAALLTMSACETDLEQFPINQVSSSSLDDYEGVLNAAYYYQLGAVTTQAVMGDFRSDNAFMFEPPYTEFDIFSGTNLKSQEDQFFRPFYSQLYKCILSANIVIENSTSATEVGEAQFLRALSYYKLILAFGDVSVNLSASPSSSDTEIQVRQPKANVYTNVVIPDLQAAMAALSSTISEGRASKFAAQALLGKVYAAMGDYGNAETHLSAVAGASQFGLEGSYTDVFDTSNELNSEVIFAVQRSGSIVDEYTYATEFPGWFGGNDSKSDYPVTEEFYNAFDASDARRNLIDVFSASPFQATSTKYSLTNAPEYDWIDIRLADVILLLAEARNENGGSAESVLDLLDGIRSRVGLAPLDHTVISSQSAVRKAILDERRFELAFEGQRWFDLVRTGSVDSEMGQSINSNYYVFPIPISEINATNGVITQNAGY
ncbi:RagB/SusD family nutrient uptake outer membrane protein [Seonamhaeicola sp. MEBiC1930]|uniref:RagB/SusD family nutrient uptake outer membrane protein n=1 Tax=Seonamhaeicola sp. MEBiC01930 TaxID=2976768 RepID=UPI0032444D79